MYKDTFATSPKAVELVVDLINDFNLYSELEARIEWAVVHSDPNESIVVRRSDGSPWYVAESELPYVRGALSIIRSYLNRLAHLTSVKIHFEYGCHFDETFQEDLYYRTVDIEYEE